MESGKHPVAQWLDRATAAIRFGPDRKEVRAELEAHLEDKTLDFQRIFPDLTEAEARERAVSEMGDPMEIGKELAKVHKPWLGYIWRASQTGQGAQALAGVYMAGQSGAAGSGTAELSGRGGDLGPPCGYPK